MVHKAVLRLLRNCVGDDIQEQLDGRNKPMGAAGNVGNHTQLSEYEEDCGYSSTLASVYAYTHLNISGQLAMHPLQQDSDVSRAVNDLHPR